MIRASEMWTAPANEHPPHGRPHPRRPMLLEPDEAPPHVHLYQAVGAILKAIESISEQIDLLRDEMIEQAKLNGDRR